jgi:hypothetical protein
MLTEKFQNFRNEPIPVSLSTDSFIRSDVDLNKGHLREKPVDKYTKYGKTNQQNFFLNIYNSKFVNKLQI